MNPQRAPAAKARAVLLSCLLSLLLASAASAAPTLARWRDTGILRLGYLTAVPPFSYHDESGRPAGYAVAMCERVASGLRERLAMPALRSEFVAVGQDARFDAVKNGNIDLLCAAGTPTLALREKVSFSIPVFPGGIGALVHKDAPARLQAVLAGDPQPANPRWGTSLGQVMQKRIFVVIPRSRSASWLEHGIREFGLTATIDPIENIDQGLEVLAERRADVMFAEREVLLYAVQHNAVAKDMTLVERKFTLEPIAFALPRGDEDFRLMVDAVLSELYRTGAWSEDYVPDFGEPDEETRRFFTNTAIPE